MKKVSVIVPVYNVEKYLRKCLNSLVNQTLKDFEIIIVNDGSTDGSQEIIEEFQAKYPERIKSFLKENGGLSDARNFGLAHVNSEFVGFVDSDDWVTENMFEQMYKLSQKNRAEMVICNLQKVDENGKVLQKLPQIPNMPEKITLKSNISVFSDLSYFACNKIFREDLFDGLQFKEGIHFEDIELIPQLLLRCKTISHTQEFHYQYLERADSISKSHTKKGLDILKAVDAVSEVYNDTLFAKNQNALKNFQILEGIYSFLAYLAFVKDEKTYHEMSAELDRFRKKHDITTLEILNYERFGKNYLLSLTPKKKIYYLLYFFGQKKLLRKLM